MPAAARLIINSRNFAMVAEASFCDPVEINCAVTVISVIGFRPALDFRVGLLSFNRFTLSYHD